jgi:hypothetical protein
MTRTARLSQPGECRKAEVQNMNQKNETRPGRLPIVNWQGADYFVDRRLRQFREVRNPHHFVDFDSPEGKEILREGKVEREYE